MTENTSKQAILILGMHRSGTSLLTRILNLHGVALATDLTKPNEFNEKGYWESRKAQEINDSIFNDLHTSWFDCYGLQLSEIPKDKIERYTSKIVEYLVENFAAPDCVLFTIKDPRICKLLPLWQNALETFGASVSVIIPFRNPLEVADSLNKRDGLSKQQGLLLWLTYLRDANRYSRDLNRAFISFDGLLSNWKFSIKSLAKGLGFKWPVVSSDIEDSVNSFISPRLKHFNHSEYDLSGLGLAGDSALQVYAALKEASSEQPDVQVGDKLDSAFSKTEGIFKRPDSIVPDVVEKHFAHQRHLKLLSVEESKAREMELAYLASNLMQNLNLRELTSSKNSEIEAVQGKLKKNVNRLKKKNKELVGSEKENANLKEEAEKQEAELARGLTREKKLSERLADSENQIARLQSELAGLQSELKVNKSELAGLREEISTLEKLVVDRDDQLSVAENKLVETSKALEDEKRLNTKLMGDIRSLDTLLRNANSALEKSSGENMQLSNQLLFQSRKLRQSQSELKSRTREVHEFQRKASHNETAIAQLELVVEQLEKENHTKSASLALRFSDIAELTRKVEELENAKPTGLLKALNAIYLLPSRAILLLKLRAAQKLVEASELFDREWYLQQYPDVMTKGVDPIEHYLLNGADEGRNPAPDFNTYSYWLQNPDVAIEKMNPLIHFIKFGANECRKLNNDRVEP